MQFSDRVNKVTEEYLKERTANQVLRPVVGFSFLSSASTKTKTNWIQLTILKTKYRIWRTRMAIASFFAGFNVEDRD